MNVMFMRNLRQASSVGRMLKGGLLACYGHVPIFRCFRFLRGSIGDVLREHSKGTHGPFRKLSWKSCTFKELYSGASHRQKTASAFSLMALSGTAIVRKMSKDSDLLDDMSF